VVVVGGPLSIGRAFRAAPRGGAAAGSGADPTVASLLSSIPLMVASVGDQLEVVRRLLSHPKAKTTIHCRNIAARTALYSACFKGQGGGCEGATGERCRPHDRRQ
jgi:hypothetical protein